MFRSNKDRSHSFGRSLTRAASLPLLLLGSQVLGTQLGCAEATPLPVEPYFPASLNVPTPDGFLHQGVADPGLDGNETNDWFGDAVVSGDFDCDGQADVAVGVPNQDVNGVAGAGAVAIFLGDDDWFVEGPMVTSDPFNPSELNDHFGEVLAAGDIDDDGCDDLVIGMPHENWGSRVDTGRVHIRWGDDVDPLSDGLHFGQDGSGANEAYDYFGEALGVGDFNNDGHADIAVGTPGEDYGYTDCGWVHVRMGTDRSSGGIITSGSWVHGFSENAADPRGDYEFFGSSLAVGNFDGDAYDDLAIGAPYEGANEGRVFVRPGSSTGLRADSRFTYVDADVPVADEMFGFAVAAGDLQGDGADDLIVGIPYGGWDEWGRVDVFASWEGELPDELTDTFEQDEVSYHYNGEKFGFALASADFDGDGLEDIAVGIPYDDDLNTQAGYVAVRYGAPVGSWTTTNENGFTGFSQSPAGLNEAYDFFGRTLATIDRRDDGIHDLLAAAPSETYGATDTGVVFVTSPELRYDTPFTGEYVDTSVPGAEVRMRLLQISSTQVEMSAWVESGTFEIDGLDCATGYSRLPADLAAGTPLVEGRTFSLSYLSDPTFSGNTSIPLTYSGYTIDFDVDFVVTGSDADVDGMWQELDLNFGEVLWDVRSSTLDGECDDGLDPDTIQFERI